MTRIVSLLPSATEIVALLGATADLVGVSHECDYPADVIGLPVLTKARCMSSFDSAAIDRSVRGVVKDALAVYEIDVDELQRLDPDVIVTQDLCDVCAVSLTDVKSAVARLTRDDVDVVSLSPLRLEDIFADIERTAVALGRESEGADAIAGLRRRVSAVAEVAGLIELRPTVLTIEWISPVMPGGTWMPELIEIAGGVPLITKPGEKTGALTREELERVDPEVVVIKPCGFDLERTSHELDKIVTELPVERWRAFRNDRVYLADGNAYFNRPGPRIVDSLEILVALMHPGCFPEFEEKYGVACRRLDRTDGVPRMVPAFPTENSRHE